MSNKFSIQLNFSDKCYSLWNNKNEFIILSKTGKVLIYDINGKLIKQSQVILQYNYIN